MSAGLNALNNKCLQMMASIEERIGRAFNEWRLIFWESYLRIGSETIPDAIIFSLPKPRDGALPPPPSNLPYSMAHSYATSNSHYLQCPKQFKVIASLRILYPRSSRRLDPDQDPWDNVYIECKYRLPDNQNHGKIT
jgi:hypothetical protein